ncbi:tyrosine-type recombinase/integrase [Kribbella qitaiheensis]|uniref:tyrosine-type recombinase/integrase n=1 Tax=Kribbella qitaiheensis TaxID=1544730 RepID=UPI003622BD48
MSDLVPVSSLAAEVAQYGPTRRVQVLVASWLAGYDSPHTRRAYARDMKMWLKFCEEIDLDPLLAIRVHLDAWRQRYCGYEARHDPSVARRLSGVSSWYEYLVQEEVLDRSPTAHVKRPNVDSSHSTTFGLDEHEARAVIKAAGEFGPRELAVISVLMLTGIRVNELVMSDVGDLGHERGHFTLDVTRKRGARQRIVLVAGAVAALEAYLDGRTSGPLIVTRQGRISPRQVQRIVKQVAVAAKVPHGEKVSPHSLRHAFVTLSLDAGAMVEEVQDAVGHKSLDTTMRYKRNRGRLDKFPGYKLAAWLNGDDEEAS